MQTPINSRDLALQNTSPRVLGINTNYVNLTCPTQQFKYGTDNAPQPALAVVTASLVGSLTGTVVFVTTGLTPVPTASGNTITINPEHMTGDVVTINASLVYQGATYQAVPITISKIFNQLVAKTTRAIDLLPAYTDGSGYTLPAADNFIELYNGVVKLDSNVVYGPATQTKGGLTAAVNASTGQITLTQASSNTWTSNSESFTFTATRGGISYNTTYTITKAKQGSGGQQLAEAYLYQWLSTEPVTPTGTSTYTWATQSHVYSNTDLWRTIVSVNPGGGAKLWKITKAVTAEASLTVTQASFTWAGGTVRQISTEANELIKTALLKIYKVDVGLPVPPIGSSDYAWATKAIQAKPNLPGQPGNPVIPIGWSLTEPEVNPGFTLWQASVSIIDSQGSSLTSVDWTTASITAISSSGRTGVSAITAVLTNDTHAIPTDYTGETINLSNSGTDLFIYEGATALVYDGVGDTAGKFKVTAAVDGVTVGTPAVVTVDGVTGVRYPDLATADFAKSGTGSVTFTVTGIRNIASGQTAGASFSYTVKQSFTKTPGGNPSVVHWITSSVSAIKSTTPVSGAAAFTPASITFTNKKSVGNITTDYTGYVKFYRNGTEVTLNPNNITSYTYTVEAGTTSVKYELYSEATFASGSLLDSETVPVVADGPKGDKGVTGTASITAVLTNDTHAIPTDSLDTENTRVLTNSGTDLFIYEGATGLAYTTGALGPGTFNVAATATGVTAGATSTVTINSAGTVVANGTAGGIIGVRFADLATAAFATSTTGKIIFTVTGQRLDATAFTYTVQQSFSKTPSGVAGQPGPAYWLISSSSVIQRTTPVTGNPAFNPTTITFTAKKSVGTTVSDYAGFLKFYRNNVNVPFVPPLSANTSSYTYTIEAGTTSVKVELYSEAAFTNLLDSETVPVVADGGKGDIGVTGNSARRAYVVATGTPAGTPATFTATGDKLPLTDDTPPVSVWFAGKTWLSAAPSTALAAGETLYQSDGVYVTGGNTTWGYPYISALKVGALSAITTNTGQLTISNGTGTGYIKGGEATDLTTGKGFYVDNDGNLRVGTPGAAQLKFDSGGLTISNAQGSNIFTVVSGAQDAAAESARLAGLAEGNATTAANSAAAAVAVAGSVTWLGDSQITAVTGTQLKRASGTGGWDYKKYSAESYIGGAYISFIPVSTVNDFMIGLNGNPATYTAGSSYAGIDYAWYVNGASGLKIYESGTERTVSGTTSYTTSTVLAIIYDGRYVKYYRDGILARTVDTTEGSNLRHYADTTWANNNGEAKSIRFGPVGPLGANGTNATINSITVTTGAPGSSASVTNTGTTSAAILNFTIPRGDKGADSTVAGPPGARGSLTGYASKYNIYATAWDNDKAYAVIYNMLAGENAQSLTYQAFYNAGWRMQVGDTVTMTNGSATVAATAAFTRYWAGTEWIDPAVIINGSLLVTGTVGANKLASNFLSANWANIGTLDSSPDPLAPSSERLVITKDTLTVYSGNVVRVKLGKLT